MSNIIIAGEAKRKVIGVLRQSDHLSKLYHTWPELAWELEVDEVNIITLRDRILVKTSTLWEAVSTIIEAWVSKKGSAATLGALVCALEKRGFKYIVERLEKEFGIEKEQQANAVEETLFNDTLPETIPYYIPRTLVSRYILDIEKLFETAARIKDVFCFTGIQRFELTSYLKNSTTDNSSTQIQRQALSTRFIVLDCDTHFPKICSKTKKPVHWIEVSQEDEDKSKKIVKWVRSTGSIETIQRSVNLNSNQQEYLSTAQLMQFVKNNKEPVCFSDCPGMGKSILLINAGHELKKDFPEKIIVHFELRLFVQKIKDLKRSITKSTLEAVLSQTLCNSGSSKETEKLNEMFSSNTVKIELLLDGFDEIFPGDVPFCLKLIKDITDLKYTRIWIASRPHLLEKIENALNVLGHNIHPFTEANQISFLSSYWISQNQSLSQIKLTKLAKKTLEIISSQTKDQDFAGIPLRCFLIAQVFEETAMDFCTVESEHEELPELLTISSTFDLFKKMVKMKVKKYYSTYGITRYRQGTLTRMLMKLAMDLIFPGQLEKLNTELVSLEVSVSDLINTGLLLQQGADDLIGAKFVHQTIAEYFCAKFVSDLVKQCGKEEKWTEERKEFFFQEVLRLDLNALSASSRELNSRDSITTEYCVELFCKGIFTGTDRVLHENGTIKSAIENFKKCLIPFAHPVICYFMNSILYKEYLTSIPAINSVCAIDSLKDIIWICVRNNFLNVFKLLTLEPLSYNGNEIFDHHFLFVLLNYGHLDFVQEGFTGFKKYQNLNLKLRLYVLSHVGKLGNYSIFEYFCKEKSFNEILLRKGVKNILASIINQSVDEWENVVNQKIQIIRYILSVNLSFIKIIHQLTLLRCHADLLCCLIEQGLDLEVQDDSKRDTLLHKYQFKSETDLYKIICSIPLDKFRRLVPMQNNDGETILNIILRNGEVSLRILEKFKTANADFNSCDKDGNTLLMIAIKKGRSVEIVKYLLMEGANPNHVDKFGISVLFCWKNKYVYYMSVFEELVKAGCDVFRQEEGSTFLHDLIISKYYSLSPSRFHAIVKMLIANGKEKLLETKSEEEPNLTPLQLAVKNLKMDEETVTLLKSVKTLNFGELMEEEGLNEQD